MSGVNVTTAPSIQKLSDSIDRLGQLEPPTDLQDFLAKGIAEDEGHDRRGRRRYALVAKVVAIPVSKQLLPIDKPFVAFSRNISAGGIAILHIRPVRSDYLFLEIHVPNHDPARTVVKVLRSRRVGRFFEIAGAFTADAANPDIAE
jgi:hypothetical protein